MPPAPLSQPVGALMRPTHCAFIEDSLSVAAQRMRENGLSLVPVLDGELLAGVVSESSLAHALAGGAQPNDSLKVALRPANQCRPYNTGAEALRQLQEAGADVLVVADDALHVVGVLLPSDLLTPRRAPIRPALVGGMATPFGVYLTSGSTYGGVRQWALMTTGATMFVMLIVAMFASDALGGLAQARGLLPLSASEDLSYALAAVLFCLEMRLAPLSGIHAAEHKVVHAIERGEELTPEVVRRMPRVHPRCGTNLAAGVSIFVWSYHGFVTMHWDEGASFLLAVILAALFWRRAGAVVQYWVTTRPPSEKHIRMGIKAGKELLERHQTARIAVPSIPLRLFNSGIFHVIAGSTIVYGLAELAAKLLGYGWF